MNYLTNLTYIYNPSTAHWGKTTSNQWELWHSRWCPGLATNESCYGHSRWCPGLATMRVVTDTHDDVLIYQQWELLRTLTMMSWSEKSSSSMLWIAFCDHPMPPMHCSVEILLINCLRFDLHRERVQRRWRDVRPFPVEPKLKVVCG